MFKRKLEIPMAQKDEPWAWDSVSIEEIKKAKKLEIAFTHIENRKRVRFKPREGQSGVENETIASGVLKTVVSQHVHVELSVFDTEGDNSFGINSFSCDGPGDSRLLIPTLVAEMFDPNTCIQQVLKDSMAHTVASGQASFDCRMYIDMSNHEQSEKHVAGEITAFFIWSEQHSPQISNWHRNVDTMSFKDFPNHLRIRRE